MQRNKNFCLSYPGCNSCSNRFFLPNQNQIFPEVILCLWHFPVLFVGFLFGNTAISLLWALCVLSADWLNNVELKNLSGNLRRHFTKKSGFYKIVTRHNQFWFWSSKQQGQTSQNAKHQSFLGWVLILKNPDFYLICLFAETMLFLEFIRPRK